MTGVRSGFSSAACWLGAVLVGGLLHVAGAGAGEPVVAQVGADGVQHATITLDSYSYTPDYLVVQAGKPVELTLTSVTTLTPHNFVLNDPAAGFVVDQNVGHGKTVTVRFTPTQPGTFTFYCDKKLLFFASHREKGMEGRLEIRQ
ncbi:MAG: cupredoxin domain-containing protein [Nitrospiraceae bacterium]